MPRHNEDHPRLYSIWADMKKRLLNSRSKSYTNYGGRGILLFNDWNRYDNFKKWALSSGYQDDLSLERVDVNGNYEPDNCTWIPRNQQAWNKQDSVLVTAFGETKSVPAWVSDSRCQVSGKCLRWRVRNGWAHDYALTEPPAIGRNQYAQ